MKFLFFSLIVAFAHQSFAKSYTLKCDYKSIVKINSQTISICRYNDNEDDCVEAALSYTDIDKAKYSKELSTEQSRVYTVRGFYKDQLDIVTVSQDLYEALLNGQTKPIPGSITYSFGSLDYSLSACSIWKK